VAENIREDGIDILVDLAGHTFGHRLLVFARKPAPVQVTWLGYPNTTGMTAMDYRVTDAWVDPPGDGDARHTETLVRLSRGFLCYQPLPDSPPVSELPSRATGYITFGCFNNSAKISTPVLDAWSEILKAVPGSRLLLKARQLRDPSLRRHFERELQKRGVDPQRVEMLGRIESKFGHLDLYGRVDIGLDPFPYNGTTTTCEALWMGVPVVVLAGDRHAGRVGVSLLTSVNLTELIAETVPEYQRIAVELALNSERLAAYRSGMRERMRQSPLLDAAGFTHAMESAYRDMWRRWCERAPADTL
jgi:predicted O-linked N-acetylglucosamine transferase (SPINDLY family)